MKLRCQTKAHVRIRHKILNGVESDVGQLEHGAEVQASPVVPPEGVLDWFAPLDPEDRLIIFLDPLDSPGTQVFSVPVCLDMFTCQVVMCEQDASLEKHDSSIKSPGPCQVVVKGSGTSIQMPLLFFVCPLSEPDRFLKLVNNSIPIRSW